MFIHFLYNQHIVTILYDVIYSRTFYDLLYVTWFMWSVTVTDVMFPLYIISYLSGIVYTESESPQYGLRNKQTYWMTLALAYVLCHLSAVWLQLQIIGRSLRWEWVLIWCVAVKHWRSSSIRVYLHQLLD